jgi:hypothetical protein
MGLPAFLHGTEGQMVLHSSLDLFPDDPAAIQALLPCDDVIVSSEEQTVTLRIITMDSLTPHALGRILILNGKCRAKGLKLVLECSPDVHKYVQSLKIDRLVWTQPLSTLP